MEATVLRLMMPYFQRLAAVAKRRRTSRDLLFFADLAVPTLEADQECKKLGPGVTQRAAVEQRMASA